MAPPDPPDAMPTCMYMYLEPEPRLHVALNSGQNPR